MSNQMSLVKFKKDLKDYEKSGFDGALPRHISPANFSRCAYTYIANNPSLLQCDERSLWCSIISIAQLGLMCEGFLGQAFIIPFNNKAQVVVGYKGYMELAWRSGKILSFSSHAVFEGDIFELSFGLEERLIHVPKNFACNPDDLIKVYAVVHLKGGGHIVKVLDRVEIDAIRDKAIGNKKNKTQTPWATNYIEMAEKTAIRRIAKFVPMATELQQAAAMEDALERGEWTSLADGSSMQLPGEEEEPITDLNKRFAGTSKPEPKPKSKSKVILETKNEPEIEESKPEDSEPIIDEDTGEVLDSPYVSLSQKYFSHVENNALMFMRASDAVPTDTTDLVDSVAEWLTATIPKGIITEEMVYEIGYNTKDVITRYVKYLEELQNK